MSKQETCQACGASVERCLTRQRDAALARVEKAEAECKAERRLATAMENDLMKATDFLGLPKGNTLGVVDGIRKLKAECERLREVVGRIPLWVEIIDVILRDDFAPTIKSKLWSFKEALSAANSDVATDPRIGRAVEGDADIEAES